MTKHKHHILPSYRGGADTRENLIEVSVTRHAMFHYCNWRLWGDDRDRIAWKGLSGEIGKEEIVSELRSLGGKKANRDHIYTEEHISMLRKLAKENHSKAVESARSEKSKIKRKNTLSKIKHQQGTKNSQYGSMWITNGTNNKKIKKTEMIPDGYKKGRVI